MRLNCVKTCVFSQMLAGMCKVRHKAFYSIVVGRRKKDEVEEKENGSCYNMHQIGRV